MDSVKHARLREMINDYQELFEAKHPDHPFVKALEEREDETDSAYDKMNELLHEQMYAAMDVGFIQGVTFAMDVMDISGAGQNRDLLEQFLKKMEDSE